MKRIVKKIAIVVAILVVVGVCVGSIVVGKMVGDGLLYQNRENDTIQNSKKQLEKWGYDWKGFIENHVLVYSIIRRRT